MFVFVLRGLEHFWVCKKGKTIPKKFLSKNITFEGLYSKQYGFEGGEGFLLNIV